MAARRLLTVLAVTLLFGAAQTARAVCHGDCGSDGNVTADDLIAGVGIALGTSAVECTAMDASGDGEVRVNELIIAVNNALNGCH